MRDVYRGFYAPTDAEAQTLWEEGVVVLDANTLLNLYRYTPATRQQFLTLLHSFGDRLWLPYQAGLEFQRNRVEVISQQLRAHDEAVRAIKKSQNDLDSELRKFTRHSTLKVDELLERHSAVVTEMVADVERRRAEHVESQHPASFLDDRIWDAVTDLFDRRVGAPFDEASLKAIYEEGAARYEKKVPPGFKDAAKEGTEKYGDLVIWKEIIRYAKDASLPVIFVTDDRKEDWWRLEQGKTLGPRVELVAEFFAETNRGIHFYTPARFLEYARDSERAMVSSETIDEARAISTKLIRENDDEYPRLLARWSELQERLEQFQSNEAGLSGGDRETWLRQIRRLTEQREQLAMLERALLDEAESEISDRRNDLLASAFSTSEHVKELDREIDKIRRLMPESSRDLFDRRRARDRLVRELRALEDRLRELETGLIASPNFEMGES